MAKNYMKVKLLDWESNVHNWKGKGAKKSHYWQMHHSFFYSPSFNMLSPAAKVFALLVITECSINATDEPVVSQSRARSVLGRSYRYLPRVLRELCDENLIEIIEEFDLHRREEKKRKEYRRGNFSKNEKVKVEKKPITIIPELAECVDPNFLSIIQKTKISEAVQQKWIKEYEDPEWIEENVICCFDHYKAKDKKPYMRSSAAYTKWLKRTVEFGDKPVSQLQRDLDHIKLMRAEGYDLILPQYQLIHKHTKEVLPKVYQVIKDADKAAGY